MINWHSLTTEQKDEQIYRDIRTPWGRKRLARAMCGEPYEAPSELEKAITPIYLGIEKIHLGRRMQSWFLRTFVGIDNRG